jgi:rare lipoprotein A
MALPGIARQCSWNFGEQSDVCSAGQGNREGAVQAQTTLLVALASFMLFAFSVAHAETGLASYYGYAKAGKGGELTCAHRTRPFGTVLRVSYSGRTIQCRVNDRGPFIRGRIVDLSVPAARALGMMSAGVVRVSVD